MLKYRKRGTHLDVFLKKTTGLQMAYNAPLISARLKDWYIGYLWDRFWTR